MRLGTVFIAALACVLPAGALGAPVVYEKPPAAIERVLDTPPVPEVSLVPGERYVAVTRPVRYPPVAQLARPMLRIAGLRIDPATNGIHHQRAVSALAFVRIADGKWLEVAVPDGANVVAIAYNADGSRFAFANATRHGTELWTGTTAAAAASRIAGVTLNTVFPEPLVWSPDGVHLTARIVDRQGPPPAETVAPGPVVQETQGRAGQIVTYEDLLQNPHDEALFDYYATSRIAIVDARSKTVARTSARGIFTAVRPSPDGKALLAERVHAPYSYLFPYERFPLATEVRTLSGALAHVVADRPLRDRIPADGVATGPRDVAWNPNAPQTLVWREALDGGDPAHDVPARDALIASAAPFAARTELLRTPQRITGLTFVQRDPRALVRWYERKTRVTTTALLDTSAPGSARTLATLRDGDRYNDPGTPVLVPAPGGEEYARRDGNAIWLHGAGYGPDSARPFLDRYDLGTATATRVFRSGLAPLEFALEPLDAQARTILITRQSPTEPPNAAVWSASGTRALTMFTDPTPELQKISRRVVSYTRPDGVALSFTLYLPPGYVEGTRLPTFLWAYPLEYNDPSVASQNTNSTQFYRPLIGASEIFMALAGYAVLDNAAIPIVGDPRTVNDTYVEQLTAGAKAAIDEAVRIGVTDPNRVAVGGHSYGAFMTANLLAHTKLFRAGIARSGAYNRTLTPFGFQNERRSYWEATDLYTKMSPFTFANEIKTPLLLIHGEADDNTGTFPIQSERLYAALQGNGGTARLVMLPYEAHGYVGRESIETTLAEMVRWLDRWVKNAAG